MVYLFIYFNRVNSNKNTRNLTRNALVRLKKIYATQCCVDLGWTLAAQSCSIPPQLTWGEKTQPKALGLREGQEELSIEDKTNSTHGN